MKIDVSIDLDVCIEGKDVKLYVYDAESEIVDERSFSVYDLIKDYLEGHQIIGTENYHLDAEDTIELKALIDELDDALTLASEVYDNGAVE